MKAFFLSLFALTALPGAADFRLDWHAVGSARTGTNGPYSLAGTVGQPAAGAMHGGPFSLVGGFWSIIAVQTAGLPTLHISHAAPGSAIIRWSPATPGFKLQVSPSLASPAWEDVPGGTAGPVTVPVTWPTRFYRLARP